MDDKYFQGVLQLRNPREAILEYLENWLQKKGGKEVSIVKKVRNGLDYYFVSNKSLLVIGKKLYSEFGGEMKQTSTLHTRDTKSNRDLYRGTVLLSFSDFVKGDLIEVDDSAFKVKSIFKNIATCVDLGSGKSRKILYLKKKIKVLDTFMVVVSKNKPSLEVLDPETYQSVEVENPVETSKQNVKVVKIGVRLIVVE